MDLSDPPMAALPVAAKSNDVDLKVRAVLDNQGSWWPAWHEWLRAHSGKPVKPPRMGLPREHPLVDAPGRYVMEK